MSIPTYWGFSYKKAFRKSTAVFAVLILLAVLIGVLIAILIVVLVRTLVILVVHNNILRYLY